MHELFVRSNMRVLRAAVRRRLYERALECGRCILRVDPLHEAAQRHVMVLLVLNGRRPDALLAYAQFRKLLRAELGIEPMPDTKALHDDIQSGAIVGKLDDYVRARFDKRGAPAGTAATVPAPLGHLQD